MVNASLPARGSCARTLVPVMLRRWLLTLGIVVLAILGWVFVVSPLSLAVLEGAVPSVTDLEVPDGAAIIGTEKNCGSGGCWIEVSLQPADGRTDSDLEQALRMGTGETCESGGPPMFWTICRFMGGDYPHRGVEVLLYYRR